MKRVILAVMVLALLAVPALAGASPRELGENPGIAMFLTSSATGAPTGVNSKPTPAPGASQNVYVGFDTFGVGGGMLAAEFMIEVSGGPTYDGCTNQFAGVGGLTIGANPADSPGVAMTTGPAQYPNVNGCVILAKITYATPEEALGRTGGYIKIIPYAAGDGPVVADSHNLLNVWCVHSVTLNGRSGNWGWDDTEIPDGTCTSPVQATSWGSIKALYR